MLHGPGASIRYLDVTYPTKPAGYAEYTAGLRAKLTEPDGRMADLIKTQSTPADAQAQATVAMVDGQGLS